MSYKKICNLAFSGGGFYGFAAIGVLKELENHKDYFDIDTISGVSVGGMIAALYAVGYTAEELTKIMFELDFDNLIKDSTTFQYNNLSEKYGLYKSDKLEKEIEKLIQLKTNIKNCTFNQIKKNLIIVCTNLNFQRARLFNKEDTPAMVISKAVRMSISYPGYISPVPYDGDLYGDGGETMNYPIIIFKDLDQTMGITYTAHNENIDGTLKTKIPINGIMDYVRTLARTMARAIYTAQIKPEHLNRSIIINITKEIDSMQFNLVKTDKEFLYQCGIDAAKEQINKIINN